MVLELSLIAFDLLSNIFEPFNFYSFQQFSGSVYLTLFQKRKKDQAKGNPEQTTVTGTQRPEAASSGLDRVREAAKRDKKQCFTNLLHHVSIERLDIAYRKLNPKRPAASTK